MGGKHCWREQGKVQKTHASDNPTISTIGRSVVRNILQVLLITECKYFSGVDGRNDYF